MVNVAHPREEGANMQSSELNNGLVCSVDWLEFTIDSMEHPGELIHALGLNPVSFVDQERGGLGYKKLYRHHTQHINIYFDGNDNMGIHVRVSGSSIEFFLNQFVETLAEENPFGGKAYAVPDFKYSPDNVLPLFCGWVLDHGHFTRIDLAVDDRGCNFFSVDELCDYLAKQQVVSKFRKWREIKENAFTGTAVGHSCYMGSRQSEVMLRVYDKQLEQQESFPWVRWELEIKHEKANKCAELLFHKVHVSKVAIGVLGDYVRIIERDDSNVSRCSVIDKWQRFMSEVEKCCLKLDKVVKTIEKKLEWLERQVKPTLAGLYAYYNCDDGFLVNNLHEHFARLSLSEQMFYAGDNYAAV